MCFTATSPTAAWPGAGPTARSGFTRAISETYVPLLDALYDLRDQGVDYHLTLGLTPVLTEQLADESVLENTVLYLKEKIAAAAGRRPPL